MLTRDVLPMRLTISTFLLLIILAIPGGNLLAQTTGGPRTTPNAPVSVRPVIVGVEFEGNEGLTDDFLAAQIQTKPTVSSFIRTFFGIFTEIQISPRVRNALRRRIDSLTGEVRYLNMTAVDADTIRLRDVYDDLGYHRARFDYRVSLDTLENRAVVHFLIREGPRYTLNGITYLGSDALPEEIRRAMATPEEFELGDDYTREAMILEVNRIVKLLQNNGYAFAALNNVTVLKLDTTFSPKSYDSALVSIYYGDRYRIGRTLYVPDTTPGLRNVDEDVVRRQIEYKEGEWYSKRKVEQTVANLYSVLGTFELVRLDTTRSLSSEDTLGMRLAVKLRRPRDLRITPDLSFERRGGNDYNAYVGLASEFSYANLGGGAERLSAQGRVSSRLRGIDPLREFQIGAGVTYYSPTVMGFDRISGSVSPSFDYAVEDKILTPDADQDIILRSMRIAGLGGITFRQPPYTFLTGITIQPLLQHVGYANIREYINGQASLKIGQHTDGISAEDTLDVINTLRERIYRTQILQGDDIDLALQIDPVAAEDFNSLKFSFILRGIFTADRRNSFFAPTEGHFGLGTVEFGANGFSGLGWVKAEADGRMYFPVLDVSTIAVRGHIGAIGPIGKTTFVPLQSLFWAGGANSIRGWGPREMLVTRSDVDRPGRDSALFASIENEGKRFQGGLMLLELMFDFRTRLFTLESASGLARQLNNLSLVGFLDAGNAYYQSYREDAELFTIGEFFRNTGVSVGASLGYDTPIGPLRFGFGVPIWDPINYPRGQEFIGGGHALKVSDFAWHVSIGHAF